MFRTAKTASKRPASTTLLCGFLFRFERYGHETGGMTVEDDDGDDDNNVVVVDIIVVDGCFSRILSLMLSSRFRRLLNLVDVACNADLILSW